MNREEIIEKLKPIVKPFVNDEEAFTNLTDKTNFITDLNINSANLVDIILDVEDIFNIVIDNESMEKMTDIENTIAIIQTKQAEK
ncbi:acyl carrier protein [Flavobacterium sp. 7A]|uniref:acyl carrier protein n=1 Tax=Flavobacterium sp. 7A TaxID=2940571 RepID=UPI002225B8E5|nr:acyl carrier protein [Flavobacterium sp. 7A]MCW2120702.1 acyl carrier protein [Flavobacterium sp. 7A]